MIFGKISPKSIFFETLERERDRERKRDERIHVSFGDFSGFVCRKSSSPELKFSASTRATHRYRKRGISPKILRRKFGEFKDFRLGSVLRLPKVSITFQKVRILPFLVLFLPLG